MHDPIKVSADRIRKESTSSRTTVNSHELVNFDDVLAKDDIRRSMSLQQNLRTRTRTRTNSGSNKGSKKEGSASTGHKKKNASGETKTFYERIVGKTPLTTAPIKPSPSQPLKNSIIRWFSKETTEERAIRSMIKIYRSKLQQEIQYSSRALARYQKKTADQIVDYERQERQLISWGLKAVIPKFHLQAWYRIERCHLCEKLAEEIGGVIDAKQKKAHTFLQNFEESSNRNTKFSLSSTEEFCMSPEKLILQDSFILSLQDRLKRMDILFGIASKQFMQLEPEFDWKDQKDRKKEFYRILYSYNELPQYSDLDNIESDLTWKSFCNWISDRNTKQKKIELEYFDFIEDSREVEGRLFQRWQTCVLLSLHTGGLYSIDRSMSDGSDQPFGESHATASSVSRDSNELRNSRPAPLKVTATSIRAFIQYFATDIIGVKYTIPRDCIAANKALAEALFYRRIAPYVFRYHDLTQRRLDDYWRLQCQRCRFVDPKAYYVMEKFLVASVPVKDSDSSVEFGAPVTFSKRAEENPVSSTAHRKGTQGGEGASIHPIPQLMPCLCYYCQTLSMSQRLQRLPDFEEGMRGEHFARSSRVLSWLRLAVTPREMASYLTLACKWILRDAIDVSGSRSIIGADEMVPLFTMVLVHAQIPNIHMILRILTDFGDYDEQGDVSYCVANMEGSIRFLMDFSADEIPAEIHHTFEQTAMYGSIVQSILGNSVASTAPITTVATSSIHSPSELPPLPLISTATIGSSIGTQLGSGKGSSSNSTAVSRAASPGPTTEAPATITSKTAATVGIASSPVPGSVPTMPYVISKPPIGRNVVETRKQEDQEAMEQLGEWLRDQKTMEDTIAILQSDGWML